MVELTYGSDILFLIIASVRATDACRGERRGGWIVAFRVLIGSFDKKREALMLCREEMKASLSGSAEWFVAGGNEFSIFDGHSLCCLMLSYPAFKATHVGE